MQIKPEHNFLDITRFLPWIFAGIFIPLLISVILIYSSFAMAFFFALMFFILFRRLHFLILGWVGGRRSLAATISTIVSVVVIILPISYFMGILISQGVEVVEQLRTWVLSKAPLELYLENRWVDRYLDYIATDFNELQAKMVQYISQAGIITLQRSGEFIVKISSLATNFVFSIFILFFIFRSADKIAPAIYRALPFPDELEAQMGQRMITVLDAVLQGNLIIALLQGFMVGLYFWTFGLPNPLLYGAVAAFFSMIPVIGTAMVWLPGSIYLYIGGHTASAFILGILGILTYQLFDSLLKPIFLDRTLRLHPLFLFLAILGGLAQFGLVGLILGPFFVASLITLWEMIQFWNEQFASKTTQTSEAGGTSEG